MRQRQKNALLLRSLTRSPPSLARVMRHACLIILLDGLFSRRPDVGNRRNPRSRCSAIFKDNIMSDACLRVTRPTDRKADCRPASRVTRKLTRFQLTAILSD